ncbi:MAG: tRNA lysidine(34) synthetase TilS [Acidobacteriota bacterium]
MGSSPFTATNPPTLSRTGTALARLEEVLERSLFSGPEPLLRSARILVAFSGGPDSLALLYGLVRLRVKLGVTVLAAHADHAQDGESATRAAQARQLAETLGVAWVSQRLVPRPAGCPESLEAWARRLRYAFLDQQQKELRADCILTAHHRDDQSETVALRMMLGSGLEGLAGIRPIHGRVRRPLLELSRHELSSALAETGLSGVLDPTNRNLERPRNRLRHCLLPALVEDEPCLGERLFRIADAARGANVRVERLLLDLVAAQTPRPALSLRRLRELEEPLQLRALTLLHRLAQQPFPPPLAAQRDLLRRLRGSASLSCDCGQGQRWLERDGHLEVGGNPEPYPPAFTYTFSMPGRVDIREIGLEMRLRRSAIEPWMFEGSRWRAALAPPANDDPTLVVRNRRPGDRIQPLGAPGSRRLKEVFIDRHVPREERDRTPLLVIEQKIAWVPGVTIDEGFRLGEHRQAWVVEIAPS